MRSRRRSLTSADDRWLWRDDAAVQRRRTTAAAATAMRRLSIIICGRFLSVRFLARQVNQSEPVEGNRG